MPKSRITTILLILILILAAITRIGWPGLTEFKADEAIPLRHRVRLVREGIMPPPITLAVAGSPHPPLMAYITAIPWVVVPDPAAVEIFFGLMGLAAVALTYWLGARYFGEHVGLIAAALFAAAPWAIFYSRKLWAQDIPLFTLITMIGLFKLIVERQWWGIALAVIGAVLLQGLHIGNVVFPIIVALALVLHWRAVLDAWRGATIRDRWVTIVITILGVAILLALMNQWISGVISGAVNPIRVTADASVGGFDPLGQLWRAGKIATGYEFHSLSGDAISLYTQLRPVPDGSLLDLIIMGVMLLGMLILIALAAAPGASRVLGTTEFTSERCGKSQRRHRRHQQRPLRDDRETAPGDSDGGSTGTKVTRRLDGWLPPAATANLRSGTEQARRFARYPGAVAKTAEIGQACAFDLKLVAPNLPDYPVPPGHTEMSWLHELTKRGAERRYPNNAKAQKQITHELAMIESLGFPGYFLIVWDIVEFCRRNDIFCQGRGSAANSAVCYALGITNADAVGLNLLFERFLSPERDGPPDIDLDIENGRREEAIQYVYERYGRENAAQVANVITYRPKSSVRDMGKALGHPQGALDAWSKQTDGYRLSDTKDHDIPQAVIDLAEQIQGFPRHLGIHSGGMVICDRPIVEVCPVEWGRMENRSVLQWDKDDCAAVGLVKIDLLGLGMLTALHLGVDLIRHHHGVHIDLATIPQEDEVYDMLCKADSIGVFQVESRAQMATLPRLKPRHFYDLVVEVALIRPGPIQGGSVHPYIRRRNGQEPVTYLHPLLEKSLAKTLGVPLFQEQLMQMAIDVANFTPGDADQLRQAMGPKRSTERMEALKGRLYEGMKANGITGETANAIYEKLAAFANFGFPESHSVSFAYLVYSSSWMKLHYPAAFCAALLNAQPMGFYSPNTLVADARRHGVTVHGPDVNISDVKATLEGPKDAPEVRLGMEYVRNVGDDLATRIAERRPYTSMEDLVRRTGATLPAVEALSTAGAFGSLRLERREALWSAGAVAQTADTRLKGVVVGADAPSLPEMTKPELTAADLWSTGVAPDSHVVQYARPALDAAGAVSVAGLEKVPSGRRISVGGVVTHRQRPATANGTIFVNLEDETGMANVICNARVWAAYRRVARSSPALLISGRLERAEGVTNLIAEKIEVLSLSAPPATKSRDFR